MKSPAPPIPVCKAVALCLVATFLAVSVCGCYGLRELEDLSLITLLGIDKGKTDPIMVTAVIAVPRRIRPSPSGSEGGGAGGQKPTVVMSREGKSVLEALRRIDESMARDVTTIDTTYVLLGEELARDDAGVILDIFTRNLEFRLTTLVGVCEGRAQDFLEKLVPVVEIDPATYLVSLTNQVSREIGSCPVTTAHEFVVAATTLETEPFVPYLVRTRRLQEPVPAAGDSGDQKEGGQAEPAQGGAEQEEDVVAVRGAAVFAVRDGKLKMVGNLDPYETIAALLLRGELLRASLPVESPGTPGNQSVVRFHHVSAHARVRKTGPRSVEASYHIRVTGSLEETQGRTGTALTEFATTMAQLATTELANLLQKTLEKLRNLGSDTINLGMAMRSKFRTWQEWEEFDWPTRFPETPVSFDVKVFVFTTGFTSTPPVPR